MFNNGCYGWIVNTQSGASAVVHYLLTVAMNTAEFQPAEQKMGTNIADL
jgi:hypothetical protein